MSTATYIEQPSYHYFECKECGFDSVQQADFNGTEACPLCAGDSGHDVRMTRRVARDTDKPEGIDMRLGTREQQFKSLQRIEKNR